MWCATALHLILAAIALGVVLHDELPVRIQIFGVIQTPAAELPFRSRLDRPPEPVSPQPEFRAPVEVSPQQVRIGRSSYVAVPTSPETAISTPEPARTFDEPGTPPVRPVSPREPREREVPKRRESPPASAAAIAAAEQELPDFEGNRPPSYPVEAYRRRWQGTVLLRVVIGEGGKVTQVSVVESSGYPVLDAAASSAVSTWRARPRGDGFVPVGWAFRLPVRFRLD
jgi:TonB family protein